ncbi:hypothetical protein AADC60_04090 [Cytobacillus pseudoceanisediminis]|uniref:MMPL family protein n=2 Tax=Cytobacillus TaxID=2675230 RepID=A0ABX3CJL6_9BACI|nr:hypothetical protein [Cytobacillus oceanisediminis]OHX40692.1 hypothetical protein BBV17_29185 [Cytobacillus oceanisediminis]
MNQTLRTNLLLIGLGLVIALSLIIPTVFNKPPLTPSETILAFYDSIKKGDAAVSLLTFDIRAEIESGTVSGMLAALENSLKTIKINIK